MAGPKSNKKKKKVEKGSTQTNNASAPPSGVAGVAPSAAAAAPPRAAAASKAAPAAASAAAQSPAEAMLQRAHLLKEQGNKQFQERRFADALHTYEVALKFCPDGHADRAVLHSNRAACYLQMRPPQYEGVIRECTLALTLHPRFPRALLRRARAFAAIGSMGRADADLKLLLKEEPNNLDAKELLEKLHAPKESSAEAAQKAAEEDTRAGSKDEEVVEKALEANGGSAETGEDGEQQVLLDDWYVELADLVRQRLGFDPLAADPFDAHAQEIVRAIEATSTSEEATPLLEAAEAKFANMAALVLVNWAAAHRVLAQRKSTPGRQAKEDAAQDKGETGGDGVDAQGGGEEAVVTNGQAATEGEEGAPAPDGEGDGSAKPQEENAEVPEAETKAPGDMVEEVLQKDEAESRTEGEKAEEAGETEEEVAERRLRDCEWTLKHLETALDKYEQALKIQPSLVDALAGVALCLAERARTKEAQGELLARGAQKVALTSSLALHVHQDYRAALAKFEHANKVLEGLEKEWAEQPQQACNKPEHNHGEEGHHHDDGVPPNLLQNLRNYARYVTESWALALSSAAQFEYKLGSEKWKEDLKQGLEVTAGLYESDAEKKEGAGKFLAALEAPLNTLNAEDLEKGADLAARVPEAGAQGAAGGSLWTEVWVQGSSGSREEGSTEGRVHAGHPVPGNELDVGGNQAGEETEGAQAVEEGADKAAEADKEKLADSVLKVFKGKDEKDAAKASGEETGELANGNGPSGSAQEAVEDAAAHPTGETQKEAASAGDAGDGNPVHAAKNFFEKLFKKKEEDEVGAKHGSVERKVLTHKEDGIAKKDDSVAKKEASTAEPGHQKQEAAKEAAEKKEAQKPHELHVPVPNEASEEDEPMTPVKDLVGRFAAWSKTG